MVIRERFVQIFCCCWQNSIFILLMCGFIMRTFMLLCKEGTYKDLLLLFLFAFDIWLQRKQAKCTFQNKSAQCVRFKHAMVFFGGGEDLKSHICLNHVCIYKLYSFEGKTWLYFGCNLLSSSFVALFRNIQLLTSY